MDKAIYCMVCGRIQEDDELFDETEDGCICPDCSGSLFEDEDEQGCFSDY